MSRELRPNLSQGRPWHADASKTHAWALRHACYLPSNADMGATACDAQRSCVWDHIRCGISWQAVRP